MNASSAEKLASARQERSAGPMRIMVLSQNLRGGGGAEKVVSNLSFALGESVELILVYPRTDKSGDHILPFKGRTLEVDLQWNNIPSGMPRKCYKLLSQALQLRQVIRKVNPDLILSSFTLSWHKVVGLLTAFKGSKSPVILRFGNPPSHEAGSREALSRLLLRIAVSTADGVIANSEGTATDLVQSLRARKERVQIIYNPIPVNDVQNQAEEAVTVPPFNGSHPVLLNVGRLAGQKNQALLIRALRRVREQVPAELAIVGGGELEEELRCLTAELSLQGAVHFLGWDTNPYKYMKRADLFVLSSDFEGFGNVLPEALACGCPVIAMDCPGAPAEILGNGQYGILSPTGDERALSDSIVRVLRDPDLRAGLAAKGRQRARDFDAEEIARQYLRVFESVMKKERPCGRKS